MKIIDEKGRLFKLINIVDLAVILAVILVFAGIMYKVRQSNLEKVTVHNKYIVSVLCPMVPEAAGKNLNNGDQIVYGNAFVNGYIISAETRPAVIESADQSGNIITTEHPELTDVIVEIKIENDPDQKLIMLGKYQVNIGKEFVVKTARVEITGTVIDITEAEE